jgi:hypothetical protein
MARLPCNNPRRSGTHHWTPVRFLKPRLSIDCGGGSDVIIHALPQSMGPDRGHLRKKEHHERIT